MNSSTAAVRWHGVADAAAFRRVANERIVDAAARAIELRGQFLIVLAGGNTPRKIYPLLRDVDTDWSLWQLYFSDERCLPVNDAGRNSRMAADAWLDHVPISHEQVHMIPAELGASTASLVYAETLRGVGEFDMVLLGLGTDGHTASLFPSHDWGVTANAADVLAVFDAPQPPLQRVSLSAARLSRSQEVLFLVEGEAKRSAINHWRFGKQLPAGAIQPGAGIDVLLESALLKS